MTTYNKPTSRVAARSTIALCLIAVAVLLTSNALLAQTQEPTSSALDAESVQICRNAVHINALDYGVVDNDESVDNTAALQAALDAAGQRHGAVVELPAGRMRFDGVLTIPTGVTLQGTYRVPPTVVHKDETPTGTTLLTYANRGVEDGQPFITLAGSNSALRGVVVIYPEWERVAPPVPYPPCVASEDTCNVAVIDCCLLNPYIGIRFHLAHRHLVRNVTGYPSSLGLFVDECYDIGHVENVHYWPFGLFYLPEDPYCKWVNVNGTAFEFARTDWEYVANTFCFGYGRGYYFSEYDHGGANGNFLGLGADSCRRAIYVEQSQTQGLLITNGEFVGRWSSEDSVCLEIAEQNKGAVMLANCSFWGPIKTCVHSKQKVGRLTLNGCEFVNWDAVHSSRVEEQSPAIAIDAGRATLIGNSFEQSGVHLSIGPNVDYVTAVGNQAPGGFRVAGDRSPIHYQESANQVDSFDLIPGAKNHYAIKVGLPGDERFLHAWYRPERGDYSFRWSTDKSFFVLPLPDDANSATITLEYFVPPEVALSAEDDQESNANQYGVFLGEKQVALLKSGDNVVEIQWNRQDDPLNDNGELVLTLACKSWIPAQTREGSDDQRQLGVQARAVTVRADSAKDDRVFDVNEHKWSD
ncbi:MAG: glycosyl hydrolase family 28-related protein [Planctomycetia bacterium]|nr:glycosyl hydrolase family 28-related protein [Planctomycetia bacterium]